MAGVEAMRVVEGKGDAESWQWAWLAGPVGAVASPQVRREGREEGQDGIGLCLSFLGLLSEITTNGWLKTTKVYSLSVLTARSLKPRCSRAMLL